MVNISIIIKNSLMILVSTSTLLACSQFLTDYKRVTNSTSATAPSFSPVAGSYDFSQIVTMASTTTGAIILYTMDGSVPTHTDGTPTGTTMTFNTDISVTADLTFNAIAYKSGIDDSTVTSAPYVINVDVAPTPRFSPTAGLYSVAKNILIYSTLGGGTILYTIDGTTPTHSSGSPIGTTLVYSNTINVNTNTTIKAMIYKSGVTDSTVATENYKICPTNYIAVPANSTVGTTANFCVAKYEMKCAADVTGAACSGAPLSQIANQPWSTITPTNARAACTSLGSGYHLISNPEWMTIARSIETTDINWSLGAVNTGQLNAGHSDNIPGNSLAASTDTDGCFGTGQTCSDITWDTQRRTFTLSNGEVIWDFAGDMEELVDRNINVGNRPYRSSDGATMNSWISWSVIDVFPQNDSISFVPLVASSTSQYGRYIAGNGGQLDFNRGGSFTDCCNRGGIYALDLNNGGFPQPFTGFRCAYTP